MLPRKTKAGRGMIELGILLHLPTVGAVARGAGKTYVPMRRLLRVRSAAQTHLTHQRDHHQQTECSLCDVTHCGNSRMCGTIRRLTAEV